MQQPHASNQHESASKNKLGDGAGLTHPACPTGGDEGLYDDHQWSVQEHLKGGWEELQPNAQLNPQREE